MNNVIDLYTYIRMNVLSVTLLNNQHTVTASSERQDVPSGRRLERTLLTTYAVKEPLQGGTAGCPRGKRHRIWTGTASHQETALTM